MEVDMRRILLLLAASFVFIALSGCATLGDILSFQGNGGSNSASSSGSTSGSSKGSSSTMSISGLSNNSEKVLEAGTYQGLTITHNSVTLTGKGAGNTVISGKVIIRGNNCKIRSLTIRGDVIIEGNNADLTSAQITGKVEAGGKNNKW
jgi:hypothetical protein